MTFKEMPYSRYDCEQLKKDLADLVAGKKVEWNPEAPKTEEKK